MSERRPEFLHEVAERLGEGAALRLAHDFGGTRQYLPLAEHLTHEHPLAHSLGLAAARELCSAFGPGHVNIPLGESASIGRRRRIVHDALAQGLSLNKTARRAGTTRRTVERIKARMKRGGKGPRPGQGRLF